MFRYRSVVIIIAPSASSFDLSFRSYCIDLLHIHAHDIDTAKHYIVLAL